MEPHKKELKQLKESLRNCIRNSMGKAVGNSIRNNTRYSRESYRGFYGREFYMGVLEFHWECCRDNITGLLVRSNRNYIALSRLLVYPVTIYPVNTTTVVALLLLYYTGRPATTTHPLPNSWELAKTHWPSWPHPELPNTTTLHRGTPPQLLSQAYSK